VDHVRATEDDGRVTEDDGRVAGSDGAGLVGVFAADLPYLTAEAVGVLVGAVAGGVDGAVFVDGRGRRQLLCGVWRVEALRGAVERLGEPEGRSMRAVFGGLSVAEVSWAGHGPGPAPYFDCDTDEDLRRADVAHARHDDGKGAWR
jgi:molybdopterin-guanine dinucleotide biosynthesis protein A